MSKLMVSKALTSAAVTSVTSDNTPKYIENFSDLGVLVKVTGATNGDIIQVNLIGGLDADLMENTPMIGCPLKITIATGKTSQLWTLNVRGIPFIQVKDIQTSNTGGGCTVDVFQGGERR